jgi:K+-transporting ATPase ATPase C chain
MKRNLLIAVLMTIVTTVLLGLIYPLAVTALAQVLMRDKANGQLIKQDGKIVGSRLLGQSFTGPSYFHSRPSAAGNGYDAANSSASNLGPTNQKLLDRVKGDAAAAQADNPNQPVPVDLVTTSGSGLDSHITPAAAAFQIPRIAKARNTTEVAIAGLIARHTEGRQWGFLGEARVNVLELNLELDKTLPLPKP